MGNCQGDQRGDDEVEDETSAGPIKHEYEHGSENDIGGIAVLLQSLQHAQDIALYGWTHLIGVLDHLAINIERRDRQRNGDQDRQQEMGSRLARQGGKIGVFEDFGRSGGIAEFGIDSCVDKCGISRLGNGLQSFHGQSVG